MIAKIPMAQQFGKFNMDYLLMGNFLIEKKEQMLLDKDIDWLKKFELD